MISKGKRRYLVTLYQPDGFFYRGGKLCYRLGDRILVGLDPRPEGVEVYGTPVAYDIEFDVLKKDYLLGTFKPSLISQWGQLGDQLSTTQFSRHHMAVGHPDNFQYRLQNELINQASGK